MLYDTTADVIRKALRGLNLAPSEAAERAGLSEKEVLSAARSPAPREILSRVAPALRLAPDALSSLPVYHPPACPMPEVHRLELPFDDETVNAWLVDTGDGIPVLFDTGAGMTDIGLELRSRGIERVHLFVTHDHDDHTGGIAGLDGMTADRAGASTGRPVLAGDRFQHGSLDITAIDLPGHCPGAVGYRVGGLEFPFLITGDALFAGSIGGCPPGAAYRNALAALHREILFLDPDTVLLPGHGPASSVRSERQANPFLAAR